MYVCMLYIYNDRWKLLGQKVRSFHPAGRIQPKKTQGVQFLMGWNSTSIARSEMFKRLHWRDAMWKDRLF